MEIIIGKKWQEKTLHYIKQSLNQSSIWLVDSALKEQYERMLLEESESKAILLQRVMTFDELFSEQLQQQQYFSYRVVAPMQSLLIIYDILNDFNGEIIQGLDIGTLEQLQKVFARFNDYQSDLEQLEDVELPSFSKKKLDECWQLYQIYLKQLDKLGLTMGNYKDITLVDVDDVHFYIDHIEHLNEQKLAMVKQMKHCTLLLTCDENEDSYTRFVKKNMGNLNAEVSIYNEKVSEFKEYLINSYQNLKADKFIGDYPVRGIKAMNQNVEVDFIAREIFHSLVSSKATYQDFVVYCCNEDYLEKVANVFDLHELPYFIDNARAVVQAKIKMLIEGLLQYTKTGDEHYLITLFRSHLYKGVFQDGLIDWFELQIKTTKSCQHEEYVKVKQDIDTLVNTFQQATYVNEKAQIILNFLTLMEVERAAIDEISRAYLSQTIDYLKQFDISIEISNEAFIDLFLAHYQLRRVKEERMMDRILVTTNSNISWKSKYMYVLGCNEESFPKIGSDNEFILNDEMIACEKAGIHLGLNLFEKIEVEYLQWFKLFYLEKDVTMSYITGSLGGDDFLVASLYLNIMKQWQGKEKSIGVNRSLQDITTKKASINIIAQYDENAEEVRFIHALAKDYCERKNQPHEVNVELFNSLINKSGKKAISPSELETYNGCPFKYYIRYGLGFYPWMDRTLKANDFGTIVHDVLDILSDLYRNEKTIIDYLNEFHIIDVDKQYELNIYGNIYQSDMVNQEDKGLFLIIHHIANNKIDFDELTKSQVYLFNKLQHDLFNTVKILIYQSTLSDFKLTEHEAWASKDIGEFVIQGRIDRVEQYQQYIKVVDYKSSQKALDLCLATLGFNIQMLLYLDMLTQNKTYEKGGVLYFNTKQRVVKMDQYLYEDGLAFEEIVKLYKMEGYINSEETLIKAIDRQYDPSVIANIKFVKTKGQYTGNLLDKMQFDELLKKVNLHVDEMLERIYHEADIRILPSHHDSPNINMLVNPCTYCDYACVCLKDVFYNENREINYVDEKTMLKILGGEHFD